jgi:fermentation-respiration switch protein FrsA (DUF1100 family)
MCRLLFTALAAFSLSACSSLLYYPTRGLHFPPARFGLAPEEVNLTSADGTKLFGWLFRHHGKGAARGAILLYHGNGENLSSHYITMIWTLSHGYDLFTFDYRGYGLSEGKPDPAGTVADGEAALRWLRARYPRTPIVLYGQSLGGAVALRNAIDLKGEVRPAALVADSTFASYRAVARRVLARGWLTWAFQWLPWLVLSDRYAPDGEIDRIAPVPLLVLHAESDEVVPFRCGEEIFGQAKDPREFWKIPGGGHTDVYLRHGDIYQKKFLAWLEGALEFSKALTAPSRARDN